MYKKAWCTSKVVVLLNKSKLLPFCRFRCRRRRRCLSSLIVEEETAINYVAGENKHLCRYLKESLIKPSVSLKKWKLIACVIKLYIYKSSNLTNKKQASFYLIKVFCGHFRIYEWIFSLPNCKSDAKSYVTLRAPLELSLKCLTFFKKDAASFFFFKKQQNEELPAIWTSSARQGLMCSDLFAFLSRSQSTCHRFIYCLKWWLAYSCFRASMANK